MSTVTEYVNHWINNTTVEGNSDRTAPVYNPATGKVTKEVRLGSVDDVNAAVAAAKAAQHGWAETSLAKRQAILFNYRNLLVERREALAAILTSEHGKVISDALGEIARGIEVVEYVTGAPELLKGQYTENASTGVDVYTSREPVGIVGIISPFNFPAMVPLWFFPVAIAAGNTVVLKPSEKDPSAVNFLAELFAEAGLPEGVLNVVHGDKVAVDTILEHEDISAISFVGSTPIARYIYENASKAGKRVQAFGGAKNHMLVLPDADLDLVADSAVNAGFGSAGERCMAISVLVAVGPVADALIPKITERMKALKVGDGTRGCDMGPLITREHRDKVASYLDIAEADGATVVVDGRGQEVDGEADGFWLSPTLIDNVSTDSKVYQDEIFGPVLSIVRVETFNEGIELINASPYGNGTAIFTNDGGAAREFQRNVTVGMVGINVPIPVPVAYHSFGGWKASHFGDARAYGPEGLAFFTRTKAVTRRWLDPSHGGINLGFPQHD
ncbi:MAG: CoA-acylating methylmalonate-semialdehyde dehydrogenase [Cryobacterium sp.]|nr:CoA-acylating methylmalonate-semialdehyde dehydrogenase [Cryobacterium sp.]